MVASWAQAAAAHARDDLRDSIWADLLDTHALRELAISVFDGHLCITQRLLYGARPYSDVVAFADSFLAEAQRLGAARGRAFAMTLRGEAKLLSGCLDEADADLQEAARLSRAIGAPPARRWRCSGGPRSRSTAGTPRPRACCSTRRWPSPASPTSASTSSTASTAPDHRRRRPRRRAGHARRGRSGGARPAGDLPGLPDHPHRARRHRRRPRRGPRPRATPRRAREMLASVVMRLPGWDAAIEEVRGHLALADGDARPAAARFRAAADGFRRAGQPLDEARCAALAANMT